MTRATANLALAFWVCACALFTGCAAPGEPRARHPIVPLAVADLSGRQSGSEMVLTFSLPTQSMDRTPLAETPSVEIYRVMLAQGATIDRKTPWRQVYEIPSQRVDTYLKAGRIEFRDPLAPDDLGRAEGSSLAYMVRTSAARTRSSENSNVLIVKVYPPPTALRDVHVEVTESAVVLSWRESNVPSGGTPGGYRVYRGEMESGESPALQDLSQAKLKAPLELLGPATVPEFRDTKFDFGKTYLYTVRSVVQFGPDSVESADSVPTVVTPRDVFPPAAPGGLEAAIIPATPQAPAYVELSWAISSEGDLAGYYVYRSDSEGTPGERIAGEILPTPAFRDISVVAGRRYFYRVSAVDRAGNESSKSSAVQMDVP